MQDYFFISYNIIGCCDRTHNSRKLIASESTVLQRRTDLMAACKTMSERETETGRQKQSEHWQGRQTLRCRSNTAVVKILLTEVYLYNIS